VTKPHRILGFIHPYKQTVKTVENYPFENVPELITKFFNASYLHVLRCHCCDLFLPYAEVSIRTIRPVSFYSHPHQGVFISFLEAEDFMIVSFGPSRLIKALSI